MPAARLGPVLAAAFLLLLSACAGANVAATRLEPAQGDQWVLVFEDQFEGDRLNSDVWVTCYWWDDDGCTNLGNNELQWYRPENVAVRDGSLRLTARPESTTGWRGRTFDYTSGMVTTGRNVDDHRVQAGLLVGHGIIEMRAWLPKGVGLWPAFWMLPDTHESRPEIDIMEMNGSRPNTMSVHIHVLSRGERRSLGERCAATDLSQNWHVYSVEWMQDRIVWYLDGKKCWEVDDVGLVPAEPMYILINLAVGGEYVGPPDETTAFPAELKVDWVRVWELGGA